MPRAPVLDCSSVSILGSSPCCVMFGVPCVAAFRVALCHLFVFVASPSSSLGSHLGFEYPGVWVHVDMAYPVYSVSVRQRCISISASVLQNITRVRMCIGSVHVCMCTCLCVYTCVCVHVCVCNMYLSMYCFCVCVRCECVGVCGWGDRCVCMHVCFGYV